MNTRNDRTGAVRATPPDSKLEEGLRKLLGADLSLQERVTQDYSSTFVTERVSILRGTGPLDLLCKYGSGYRDPSSGHLRGVEYEASIYRDLLPDDNLATPRCHGALAMDGNNCGLVLEFVEGYRLSHSPYPTGLLWACTDLARFHAQGPRIPNSLNRFDRRYFMRWAVEMTSGGGADGPIRHAIDRLGEALMTVVAVLAGAPQTLVHGELYPANVIVNESGVVVVDWESAGIGPGVLDYAVLTQGHWDSDLVAECEAAYWRYTGMGDNVQATRTLAAARVFASVQLLHHLRTKETDGSAENRALDEIAIQIPVLRSLPS